MIIETLQSCKDLTTTECVLAEYILGNVDAVTTMTIRELAQEAAVSPPTVSRLCNKLGLSSYNDFKVQLATEHQKLIHKLQKVDLNHPFNERDSAYKITKKLADLSIEQIQSAYQSIDPLLLEQVAHAVCLRRQIFLFGIGLSHTVTQSFSERLTRIGYVVSASPDTGIQVAHACLAEAKSSVAIVISHSGMTRDVLRCAQKLHKNKVPTLLITGNPLSPMNPYSNWVCCLSSAEKLTMQEKIDCFGFQTSVHYLLDCLYSMIFGHDYEANAEKARIVNQEQFNR